MFSNNMRFSLFLIFAFYISCNLKVTKKTNLEKAEILSMDAFFLLLPDEVFYINQYQPTLSKEERQRILKATTAAQAMALSTGFRIDTTQSSDSFLQVTTINDDGVSISLKTWQRKDQSIILGAILSVGDMCCDYSNLSLFHYTNAGLEEVTDELFPRLEIEDFVPDIDATTKALLPSPIERSISVSPENDFLEVSIYNTPSVYDLEDASIITNKVLKLVWKGDRFLIGAE